MRRPGPNIGSNSSEKMTGSGEYSYPRYLTAKKSIDDRAINQTVLAGVRRRLAHGAAERALRILEIGCGIGTMVERVMDWNLARHCRYTAVDRDPGHIEQARIRLGGWAAANGYRLTLLEGEAYRLAKNHRELVLRLLRADAHGLSPGAHGLKRCDLVLAHAFMDLADIEHLLPLLRQMLLPGGLLYFTLNFDGQTVIMPEVSPDLDRHIVDLYHLSMDLRPQIRRQPMRAQAAGPARLRKRRDRGRRQFGLDRLPAPGRLPARRSLFPALYHSYHSPGTSQPPRPAPRGFPSLERPAAPPDR